MIGMTVSHYRILEKLGQGGMGQVFKAEDTRLKRLVALKFLAPELTTDAKAVERFIYEAQTASSLDHQNICTIYEIGEHHGQIFIAMAFYEGETLQEKLQHGPLPEQEAIDIATQLAHALTLTHAKGILHRDIKSSNIILRKDGQVKLIDFGIATLQEHMDSSAHGTVTHMAPEQLKGQPIDQQADLWALGVVLYHMLAGALPFNGSHEHEITFSILNENPQPVPKIREPLHQILKKLLSKKKETRYTSAETLASDLKPLAPDAITPYSFAQKRSKRNRNVLLGLVFLLAVPFTFMLPFRDSQPETPRFKKSVKITSTIGVENSPTWAPDARTLAFEAAKPGKGVQNTDIWIRQIDSGLPINRTKSYTSRDKFPSWSPDGTHIAFWSDRDGGGIYLMPAFSGEAELIAKDFEYPFNRPQWSLNSQSLAFLKREPVANAVELQIVDVKSNAAQSFKIPVQTGWILDLDWSPNNQFFTYVDAFDRSAQITQIWLFRVIDSKYIQITDGASEDWYPSFSRDNRFIYFVSNRAGSRDLWRQEIDMTGNPIGEAQAVTNGIGMGSIAFSHDEKRLAFSKSRKIANLWRIKIRNNNTATWADAEQLTFDEALVEFVDISPDGNKLAFSSDRNGNSDIWQLALEDLRLTQITNVQSPDWAPRWSPNGKSLVYYSFASGTRNIYKVPATGGKPLRMSHTNVTDWMPSWSRDGTQIVFSSYRKGTEDICLMDARSGEITQLTYAATSHSNAEFSMDGRSIYFTSHNGTGSHLMKISAEGGAPEFISQLTTDKTLGYFRIAPDGKHAYFINISTASGNIWAVNLENGEKWPVADFSGKYGMLASFALAVDGEFLYFAWEEDIGDLWVMDVEK